MISWIVASHRPDILQQHLGPSLALQGDDELVLVEDQQSITCAYAEGQERATQPVKAYIHHDVRITNYPVLRQQLIENTTKDNVGIVGVIGSRTPILPWWVGSLLGSVIDVRLGTLNYGLGGWCSVLDGLLLATTNHVEWVTDAPGWHGYDHDACLQSLAQGRLNFCLTNGHTMVAHYATSPTSIDAAVGWHEAVLWYQERWDQFNQQITTGVQADVPL